MGHFFGGAPNPREEGIRHDAQTFGLVLIRGDLGVRNQRARAGRRHLAIRFFRQRRERDDDRGTCSAESQPAAPAAAPPVATTPAANTAAAQAPATQVDPAAATAVPATPAGATTEMDAGTYSVRLRDLEHNVNELKEQIFRSKARLSLLAETVLQGVVAGAQARIVHENKMGDSYKLVKAVYALDGAPIFNKADEEGELGERRSSTCTTAASSPAITRSPSSSSTAATATASSRTSRAIASR